MIKRSSALPGCALCDRKNYISFHHLVPRSCHRNKWFRKNFDKIDMRERGIDVCRRCHSFLHKQFPEKYLGRHLNTLAAIQENAVVQSYLAWARKQAARDVETTSAADGGQ